MTALRTFIDEVANALDARSDKPLAPHHWIAFVKLLADIESNDALHELRHKMEQVVTQPGVRFQDRCLALIPLLGDPANDPAIAAIFNRRREAALRAVAAL